MFGNPQDIVAIIAGAALIFGAGGAAIRARTVKPEERTPEPPEAPVALRENERVD